MDIIAGLTAVSETLKITKELRAIDAEVDKATLKLRLADLVDGLLEAKEALQDAKERERELLKEIADLKIEFAEKANWEDENGCLYKLDESGNRIGLPFCNLCFVRDGKKYRLKRVEDSEFGSAGFLCDNCQGQNYD
jgi:hypothetical protein